MKKRTYNRKKLNPYELIYTGNQQEGKSEAQLFVYNSDKIKESESVQLSDFKKMEEDHSVYWLNLHGIHDVELIKKLCNNLGVHNLTIQDILDVNQRPKYEIFEKYSFVSIKSILSSPEASYEEEQLSFILGKNFLLSFQERRADHFSHIRTRLRNKTGLVRDRGADYLLFLLLEAILDNYSNSVFKIQNISEKLGLIDLDSDPSPSSLKEMEHYKRQAQQIKKTIVPIKEFVTKIEREKSSFIKEEYMNYYFDLRDLCLLLKDECDTIESRLDSSTNLFFSIQGHRMNQIMKTLTVVASVFIPLTFIAGIYGMNFNNMPELHWKWGYYAVWGLMILLFIVMMIYFRRKKWF